MAGIALAALIGLGIGLITGALFQAAHGKPFAQVERKRLRPKSKEG